MHKYYSDELAKTVVSVTASDIRQLIRMYAKEKGLALNADEVFVVEIKISDQYHHRLPEQAPDDSGSD